ncbi:EamA family transporter, partial [Pseudomonas aeruginosa]
MPVAHILLALLVTLIWGLNFVVIKVGLGDFPPLL